MVCQVLTDGRSAACIVRDGHTTHTPSPTHHIVANTAVHCNGRRKGSRQHIGRMFQPVGCVARDLVGERESTSTCTGQHSPTTDTMRQRATYTLRPRARCVQYLSPRAAKRPSETMQALMQWADVTRCRRSGIPSVKSGVQAGASFSSLTQYASSHLEWTSHARPGLISKYVSSARRAISQPPSRSMAPQRMLVCRPQSSRSGVTLCCREMRVECAHSYTANQDCGAAAHAMLASRASSS